MVASGHKRSLGASKRRVNATKVEELSSSPSKSEVPFFFFYTYNFGINIELNCN